MTRTARHAASLGRFAQWLAVLFAPGRGGAAEEQAGPPSRTVLDNGITVLLLPLPEANHVAVEAVYRVGFLHEPKGMTQAAHLLEHIACHGATKSFAPGEAMRRLGERGMANAETLADHTRYDYVLPATDLELALQIEAERLGSLVIDPTIVAQEAPRCYEETALVEQNPRAGMIKHAFMALNQAWHHRAEHALVRGGLEAIPLGDLIAFHRAAYRPQDLVLVVVGGFDRSEALALVNKDLGIIPRSPAAAVAPIAWGEAGRQATVRWDSKVQAVCVAVPPPEQTDERLLLSVLGNMLMQRLMADRQVTGAADAVFATNITWSCATLPFFLYATAKPASDLSALQGLLAARLQALATQPPADAEVAPLRAMALEYVGDPRLTWRDIQRQARMIAGQLRQKPEQATGMVLGNLGIQLGMRELLLGSDGASLAQGLEALTAEQLQAILQRTLDPAKQFATLLVPEG